MLNKILTAFVPVILVTLISSCTWVKTTPDGAKVRVVTASEVGNCERKGEVTASLKSRVGAFERKPGKVAGELETLARNEGAEMGGDTVVAESNVKEGRQDFSIYKCNP
jgi:hypothetical protein